MLFTRTAKSKTLDSPRTGKDKVGAHAFAGEAYFALSFCSDCVRQHLTFIFLL